MQQRKSSAVSTAFSAFRLARRSAAAASEAADACAAAKRSALLRLGFTAFKQAKLDAAHAEQASDQAATARKTAGLRSALHAWLGAVQQAQQAVATAEVLHRCAALRWPGQGSSASLALCVEMTPSTDAPECRIVAAQQAQSQAQTLHRLVAKLLDTVCCITGSAGQQPRARPGRHGRQPWQRRQSRQLQHIRCRTGPCQSGSGLRWPSGETGLQTARQALLHPGNHRSGRTSVTGVGDVSSVSITPQKKPTLAETSRC